MLKTIRNKISMKNINLFHALVTATLLMYLGKYKQESNPIVYNLFYLEAIFIVLLVGIPKSLKLKYWSIIKLIHYIVILPLFIYLGTYKNLSNTMYESIFGLGLIVFVYHIYKFYTRL